MRAFGLTVSILLHLLFGWLLFGQKLHSSLLGSGGSDVAAEDDRSTDTGEAVPRQPDASSSSGDASIETSRGPMDDAVPTQPHRTNRRLSPEEARGYEAGKANFERAGIRWMNSLLCGREIAELMELPVGDAWKALSERVRHGDDTAAHALLDLSGSCNAASRSTRAGARFGFSR